MDIATAGVFLGASISGAGFVFAFSSLITPLIEGLKESRKKQVKEKLDAFRKILKDSYKDQAIKDIPQIKDLLDSLEYAQENPLRILRLPTATFVLFIASALASTFVIVGWETELASIALINVFGLAILAFLLLGVNTLSYYEEIHKQKDKT